MADETHNAADAATDEAKRNADFAANQAKSGADQAANFAKGAAERMREAGQKATQGFQERVVEPAQRAAQAKDLSDVMRIQGEYLREQSQRSMSQAREIGEMIVQFGRDSVGAMRMGGGGDGTRMGGE